ncbi:hypothetical protein Ga0061079_1211, partial [Apibacter mensalis]
MATENEFDRLNEYCYQIENTYDKYTLLLIELVLIHKIILNEKAFSFYNYALLAKKAKVITRNMYSELYFHLKKSITNEWNLSNKKNDELVNKIKILKNNTKYYKRNEAPLHAFFERKRNGLNLSNRVWNLTTQHRKELELCIDACLRDGKSAHSLSSEIKKYLNEPDKLFRKVKDQNNKTTLSKAAKEYSPGTGVYRSSKKNALRLTRTEINIAYKTADIERWESMPFVVGYEIKRSNNPYPCKTCEALKGKYPKYFKFVGWHPQCLCSMTPILMTHQEML